MCVFVCVRVANTLSRGALRRVCVQRPRRHQRWLRRRRRRPPPLPSTCSHWTAAATATMASATRRHSMRRVHSRNRRRAIAAHRDDRDQCAVKVINVLHVLATLTASANASLSCCVCCLYVLLWWYVSSALLGHCFRSVDC